MRDRDAGRPFRRLFRLRPRTATEAHLDADEELNSVMTARIDALGQRGLNPADAQIEAARHLGGPVEEVRGRLHHSAERRERHLRIRDRFDELRQDVRFALRGLRTNPGFTGTVIITLALGIGANATMFGIVDRLLLRPPALVRDPGRVGRLYFTQTFSWAGRVTRVTQTAAGYPEYLHLAQQARSLAGVAAYFPSAASLGTGASADSVRRVLATSSYFQVLGIHPAAGRFFRDDEDRPHHAENVAVLEYGFWQRRFGGDLGVLGRHIRIGKKPYTVIGIAPRGFVGVDPEATDVWVPMSAAAADVMGDQWFAAPTHNLLWLTIVARLRHGASPVQAGAEATTFFRQGLAAAEASEAPARPVGGPAGAGPADSTARATFGPIVTARGALSLSRGAADATTALVSLWLAGMAAVVLLIACANVANLLLSRALRRRREMTVRVALGAGRFRLARQLLTESTLLAASGGAAGVVVAWWAGGIARRSLLADVAWSAPIDARVLTFALVATGVTGIAVGLLPALHATRPDVAEGLKSGSREGGTFRRSKTRSALLIAQAALSLVLLVGAGLFVRSLRRALASDMGFDAARVVVATLPTGEVDYTRREVIEFYRTARERLRGFPGVVNAAFAASVPFWSSKAVQLGIPGRDSMPQVRDGGPYIVSASPEYFATLGSRLIRGRTFTAADVAPRPRVAVVDQTMARLIWPGEEAVGRCMRIGGAAQCAEVIGVVQDARRSDIHADPVMQYWVPLSPDEPPEALFIRTAGDAEASLAPIRQLLQGLRPDLPRLRVTALQSFVNSRLQPWRLGATVFAVFGALALVIAAVGLYGVLAYEVTQRQHEFGVRMALGASGSSVISLVVRRAVLLVGAGAAIGAVVAVAASPRVAPLLFDTSATDAAVFAVVTTTLLLTAVLAGLIPAWRASRADPASALRSD